MSTLTIADARPVYRHVVVLRKSAVAMTADPATLARVHRQLKEIEAGTRTEVDSDIAHLVKKDWLRGSLKRVFGDSVTEEAAETIRRSQGPAIVVGSLHKEKVPGGNEPLPQHAIAWSIPVSGAEKDPQAAFLTAAEALQKRFQEFSDSKFKLLSPEMQAGITLVTVVYSPISAYTGANTGFDVGMEFHQVSRFGPVDAGTFEVASTDGHFPVSPPSDGYMMMLMKSAAEIGPLSGFLTDEQRESMGAKRRV